VLFSGLAATAFGNIVWNRAIATIGVARTAIFLYWVPIFGVAFAALLLGEALSWWHLLGFVAVMGGTWLGTRRPVVMVAFAS
jgi:drug/metabolite transporter (DMT)-like permease